MTSKDIIAALKRHFRDDARWMISNSFIFDPKEWESDFLLIQKSGLTHELEIKVGRTDFLLDSRKHKHRIFINPFQKRYYAVYRKNVYHGEDGPNYFEIAWVAHKGPVPHRFSYVCESGLIKFEEVPPHAGLIWISESGSATVVKVAPQIHSKPIDLRDILLEKFYWQASSFEDKWHAALKKLQIFRRGDDD